MICYMNSVYNVLGAFNWIPFKIYMFHFHTISKGRYSGYEFVTGDMLFVVITTVITGTKEIRAMCLMQEYISKEGVHPHIHYALPVLSYLWYI
jgi:hypothetical protein